MKKSKKYLAAKELIDCNKLYNLPEALELVKKTKIANFDATVECNFCLKLDPKKVEQNLRSSLVLPNGSGKNLKIAVLAKGLQLEKAKELNIHYAGNQDLIDRISKKILDFDVLICTPDLMPSISKLGRILGPKGLMPNPKLGTVTENIEQTIKDINKGRIEYRVDKSGNIHTIIGKISFSKEQLTENLKFLYSHLSLNKPKTVKGNFFKSVTISSTMAPGIKIDHLSIQ
ncbi:50S ribosomal protein L1 [Candidatus Phytoplasma palmae]|uniref:50S ribosomal protein L1 n=1 Tax=Candidatus Phytoplasma palmae TaxID=85624 RepID=UPI0039908B6D